MPCSTLTKSHACTPSPHELINYKDTKAKCRHLKKLACDRCFLEFIYWRYDQSCWYFRPSFVNCCPSNLLSDSNLPPLPLTCVNKYTVYTYTVWKGVRGYGVVLGLRSINTCRKVPLEVNFFRWRHFALPSIYESYLSTLLPVYRPFFCLCF
jgi:hypothetical protein